MQHIENLTLQIEPRLNLDDAEKQLKSVSKDNPSK